MEKDHLLTDKPIEPGTDRLSWRYLLIVPFIVSYYLAFATSFYAINEWIQHTTQARVFGNTTFNSTKHCGVRNESQQDESLYEQVESETARWQMLFNTAPYVIGTIASAILPPYSDCYGRRFIMILSTSGLVAKFALCTATIYFELSPLFVVVGALVDGAGGTFLCVVSGIFSYAADLTPPDRKRTFYLTALDGLLMVCIMLSSLVAGYVIQIVGFLDSMLICCGCLLLALFFVVFLVPESYPKSARTESPSVCAILKRTFSFYTSDTFKHKRRAYLILLVCYVLENMANQGRAAIEMLYQLGAPFCLTAEQIGLFSSARHLVQGLAAIFLLKPLQKIFSDLNVAIISLLLGVGSYVLEALAYTKFMLYMGKLIIEMYFYRGIRALQNDRKSNTQEKV